MSDPVIARFDLARAAGGGRLDLSGLQLVELPVLPADLAGVTELDLSSNRLRALPDWVWALGSLQRLDLGSNQLASLDTAIGRLASLESLDLSENFLAALPETIAALRLLRKLELFRNRLSNLPAALADLPLLQFLDASNNRLAAWPGAAGTAFPSLRTLDASRNRLEAVPASLAAARALEFFDLTDNRLTAIDEADLPRTIRRLRLDTNPIVSLSDAVATHVRDGTVTVDGDPLDAVSRAKVADASRPSRSDAPSLSPAGALDPAARRFDAPRWNVPYTLEADANVVAEGIDTFYKHFSKTRAVLEFDDGTRVDLRALPRKAALKAVAARGDTEAVRISFPRDLGIGDASGAVDFARAALARSPDLALIGEVVAVEPAPLPGNAKAVAPAPPDEVDAEAGDPLDPTAGQATVDDEPNEGRDPRVFHFTLTGDDARGATMRRASLATLAFRHGMPGPDAIATVAHQALRDARDHDTEILLVVSARGGLEIVGARSRAARFRDAAMLAPVEFTVEAARAATDDDAIHVDFVVRGVTVHQTDLAIGIAEPGLVLDDAGLASTADRAPQSLVALAARVAPAPKEHVELALSFERLHFRMDLVHRRGDEIVAAFECVSDLDRTQLQILIGSINGRLKNAYADETFWSGYDGKGDRAHATLVDLKRLVAVAGAALDDGLRSDPELARVLHHVETEVAAGTTITVRTDNVFLPWELLYPRPMPPHPTAEQRAANPVEPERFWGARFAFETIQQRGDGAVAAFVERHRATPPAISINLDPEIRADKLADDAQPLEVHAAWARRLGTRKLLDGAVNRTCDDVRGVVQSAKGRATLIYVYCHGASPHPFGGTGESLELCGDCSLEPSDLKGRGVEQYAGAPIVFANACSVAAHSPLAFSSFLAGFRARGALGMIAPVFEVPIVFAAHFGEEVVECYLERCGSLAAALHRLRRRHLLEHGNPVPLFYALQCQLTFENQTPPT